MTAALGGAGSGGGGEYEYVVGEAGAARLDAWLAGRPALAAAGLSRSRLNGLARAGCVTVNGVEARPAQRVRSGDVVLVCVPPPQAPGDLTPQDLPLSIIYEDAAVAVVDKPAGLPVHPGPGHPDGTLVNALLFHCPDIRGIGGELRPGIVHRLDRDTSGLLAVAKTQQAHQRLTEQMQRRVTLKEYRAVAVGIVTPAEGVIDAPIGRHPYHRQKMAAAADGRPARTHYRTDAVGNGHTLLTVRLETGRTHQIRVHLAHRRYPILGDAVYGRASGILGRQFLHAGRLGFYHPTTGEWSEYTAPLPDDLQQAWQAAAGAVGASRNDGSGVRVQVAAMAVPP